VTRALRKLPRISHCGQPASTSSPRCVNVELGPRRFWSSMNHSNTRTITHYQHDTTIRQVSLPKPPRNECVGTTKAEHSVEHRNQCQSRRLISSSHPGGGLESNGVHRDNAGAETCKLPVTESPRCAGRVAFGLSLAATDTRENRRSSTATDGRGGVFAWVRRINAPFSFSAGYEDTQDDSSTK